MTEIKQEGGKRRKKASKKSSKKSSKKASKKKSSKKKSSKKMTETSVQEGGRRKKGSKKASKKGSKKSSKKQKRAAPAHSALQTEVIKMIVAKDGIIFREAMKKLKEYGKKANGREHEKGGDYIAYLKATKEYLKKHA